MYLFQFFLENKMFEFYSCLGASQLRNGIQYDHILQPILIFGLNGSVIRSDYAHFQRIFLSLSLCAATHHCSLIVDFFSSPLCCWETQEIEEQFESYINVFFFSYSYYENYRISYSLLLLILFVLQPNGFVIYFYPCISCCTLFSFIQQFGRLYYQLQIF